MNRCSLSRHRASRILTGQSHGLLEQRYEYTSCAAMFKSWSDCMNKHLFYRSCWDAYIFCTNLWYIKRKHTLTLIPRAGRPNCSAHSSIYPWAGHFERSNFTIWGCSPGEPFSSSQRSVANLMNAKLQILTSLSSRWASKCSQRSASYLALFRCAGHAHVKHAADAHRFRHLIARCSRNAVFQNVQFGELRV